jgi:hypothetical protein
MTPHAVQRTACLGGGRLCTSINLEGDTTMNLDNMNMPMCGMHTSGAPEWLLLALAVWFFAGSGFYLFRTLFADSVKKVYGYFDLENEVGHGLCLLGMVTMLAPTLLPISATIWTFVLAAASLWFTARALTWGKRVPYATKWWWDWAHVVMLSGMAIMFAGVTTFWLTVPLGIFWTWLFGYYSYELVHDVKSRKTFYIGSDLAHASMGLVMLLMTAMPSYFMAHMAM